MSKNSHQETKKNFSPNLGFIVAGIASGTILFNSGNHYLIGLGLVIPFIGGETIDKRVSLAIGETISFLPPEIASSFVNAHPFLTAGMVSAGACYYYQEEIADFIYQSTIGAMYDLLSAET